MAIDIKTKTISELKGFRFFIPSYQRGYRWTKQEVTAFLEDLKEFSDDNGKGETGGVRPTHLTYSHISHN